MPKGRKVNQGGGEHCFLISVRYLRKAFGTCFGLLEYAPSPPHATVFVFSIQHVKTRQPVQNKYLVYAVKKWVVI